MGSVQHAGDEVSELENRQEPRLVRALEMVAPGTAVREGIDAIVQARLGALICIGDDSELSFLYSGGIKIDVDYTPAERGCVTRFELVMKMPAHLSEDQVEKLQVIAAKCPIHRTLEGEVAFEERIELN